MKTNNIIDEEFLLKQGFYKVDEITYELRTLYVLIVCHRNYDRFYFELSGVYIGLIVNKSQFRSLLYGLCGDLISVYGT